MLAVLSTAPPAPHLLQSCHPENTISFPSHQQANNAGLMSAKRPKLSLNTTNINPKLAAATNGVFKAVADSIATPTTLNTLTNSFDLSYRPSPVHSTASPSSSNLRKPAFPPSPSTIKSFKDEPYSLNLPFGIRSILKNSPLPQEYRRASIGTATSSPYGGSRRVFFPAPKKVSFKVDLEEEIVTKVYVARHLDLSSSEDESTTSDSDEIAEGSGQTEEGKLEIPSSDSDELSPHGKRKRITFSEVVERATSRKIETRRRSPPRRTKRKKRRWEWTLGPLRDESQPLTDALKNSKFEMPDSAVSLTPTDTFSCVGRRTSLSVDFDAFGSGGVGDD